MSKRPVPRWIQNRARADRITRLLKSEPAYAYEGGSVGVTDALTDLLTDAHHFARLKGIDIALCLGRATVHFDAEHRQERD